MKPEWAIIVGLTLQTVVILGALLRLHGSAMRKIGEFETKVDAMWDAYTRDRSIGA